MDIELLLEDFGRYYENAGQNQSRIKSKIRAKSSIDEEATLITTNDTVWKAAEARMTRVIQPFQKLWTPIETLSLIPVEIRQYRVKIDQPSYPDDLKDTWAGFLTDTNLNRAEWIFVRWIVEEHILPQAQQDLELNEKYKGEYVAPTSGVAGAAGTSMNGLKTIINTHITDGRITPIATGALDNDNKIFVQQIEDWADQINPLYTNYPMTLKMSPERYRKFIRGMNSLYNTNYAQTDVAMLWQYPIKVKPELAMTGSDKIFMTTKENFITLRKDLANQSKVKAETLDRLLKIFTDFYMGLGFVIPELVFTNDLDLV